MQANQNKLNHRKIGMLLVLCVALAGIVTVMSLVVPGQGPLRDPKESFSIKTERPLAKTIEMLENKYGFVITYEDPRYIHSSDIADATQKVPRNLANSKRGEAPRLLVPKGGTLTFEYDVASATNSSSQAKVVQQLLNAYSASGNAGRFRLEKTGAVIHVIPTAVKNSAGKLASQESLLDSVITVPAGERSGVRTLEAIRDAISQATHERILIVGFPFRSFLRYREQQEIASARARDALLQFLERVGNGSKLSWQLLYNPGLKLYVLNIYQLPN